MKKLIKLFLSLSLLTIMSSCENYNEHNFPGYSDLERPKNVTTYAYQLTGTDFESIGKLVKDSAELIITDKNKSLKSSEAELAKATNKADSTTIQDQIAKLKSEIASLKQETNYVAGMAIFNNKYFSNQYPVSKYATAFLNSKYKLADVGSTVSLTYKYRDDADTLLITNALNKYTLTITDYDALGEALNQPGKNNYFNSATNPDIFIPRLLITKYPLAQSGDLRMIRYQFNDGTATVGNYTIYQFNGTNWIPNSKTEQFVFTTSRKWEFDPTLVFEPLKPDYLMLMMYMHDHDGERLPLLEGYNDWTEKDTARFVINPKYPLVDNNYSSIFTEFFFGTAQNYANIDMYINKRVYSSDYALQSYFKTVDNDASMDADAKKNAKNAFMEKRVKQGLALLLSLKYPTLETKVKGIDQLIKIRVQLYDGNRWYWEYKYKCVEIGRFEYVDRIKWK